MNNNSKSTVTPSPNERLNGNLTAQPKDIPQVDQNAADAEMGPAVDYGEASLQDAKESGYTDENGKAISKAKPDVEGSPTGAYTDIGAGRSSAIRHSRNTPH